MRFLSDWCGDIACVKVRASPLLIFYDIFLYSGCQWESDRDPSLIEDYSRLWREGVVISCKPSSLRTLTSLNDTKREEITRHFSPPGISLEVRLSGGSDTNTMLKKYKRKRTVRERIKETLNATDPPPPDSVFRGACQRSPIPFDIRGLWRQKSSGGLPQAKICNTTLIIEEY